MIDLNSSKFSRRTSASSDFSLSRSALNPEASKTLSINSVNVKSSEIDFNFSIVFLNSSSFPDVIAS